MKRPYIYFQLLCSFFTWKFFYQSLKVPLLMRCCLYSVDLSRYLVQTYIHLPIWLLFYTKVHLSCMLLLVLKKSLSHSFYVELQFLSTDADPGTWTWITNLWETSFDVTLWCHTAWHYNRFTLKLELDWPSRWPYFTLKINFSGSTTIFLYSWYIILPELAIWGIG